MDDKLKFFWNLDVLVKMCRSKSDGPSLRIEEEELETEISDYKQEIEEIKLQIEEEIYDTSAEMADRNIEIITKKQLQTLKQTLKEKNKDLEDLKEEEKKLYSNTTLLRDTKDSYGKYISSMQDRINEATEYEVIDRYNSLIAETSEKIGKLNKEIDEENIDYEKVQKNIMELIEEIAQLEEKIDKKKKLLAETQKNLENKDNYIDKTKKEKNNKRIIELETKIQRLEKRLEEIKKDPKYLEIKIKDIVNNNEDIDSARKYIINLVNIVIRQPYINITANNELEEELLRATQARDNFANEIDQKNYNILDANTPEKIRIEFLTARIAKWQEELNSLKEKVAAVDKDSEFDYEEKDKVLKEMISDMKNDLNEFQKAYDETPDINIGVKTSIKISLNEKRQDIIEAEKIATAFRKDESEDIAKATRILKYECEQLNTCIKNAESEINNIKDRLISKKSGAIDITTKNKDKDILKELAQTVIDLKHRRQFAETPLEIIKRIEKDLNIDIINGIEREIIEKTSKISHKNYDEFIKKEDDKLLDEAEITTELLDTQETKRGIKVVTETQIAPISIEITEDISENKDDKSEVISQDIQEEQKTSDNNEKEEKNLSKEPKEIEEIGEFLDETDVIEQIDDLNTESLKDNIENIEETEPQLNKEDNVEDTELDIEAIVDSVQSKKNTDNDLSLDAIFKQDQIDNISIEKLEDELEKHLNNLNNLEN